MFNRFIATGKRTKIPKTWKWKPMAIAIGLNLRFIDSLRFMAASLDKLSGTLKIDQFVNLKKYYNGNQLRLLLT